jgi:hypothetical protein
MRFVRFIIALGIIGIVGCFGLWSPSPAQADPNGQTDACRRYDILSQAAGDKIKVDDDIVAMARRHCYQDIKAADSVPLRHVVDSEKRRADKPCNAVKQATKQHAKAASIQHLEAECIADWTEYVRYQQAYVKSSFQGFSFGWKVFSCLAVMAFIGAGCVWAYLTASAGKGSTRTGDNWTYRQ